MAGEHIKVNTKYHRKYLSLPRIMGTEPLELGPLGCWFSLAWRFAFSLRFFVASSGCFLIFFVASSGWLFIFFVCDCSSDDLRYFRLLDAILLIQSMYTFLSTSPVELTRFTHSLKDKKRKYISHAIRLNISVIRSSLILLTKQSFK